MPLSDDGLSLLEIENRYAIRIRDVIGNPDGLELVVSRHRHTSALPTCRRQRPCDTRDGDRDRSINSRAYRSASAVRVPFVTQALHLELYAPNSISEHVIAVQFGNTSVQRLSNIRG